MLRSMLYTLVLAPALALAVASCSGTESTGEDDEAMRTPASEIIGTFRADARTPGDLEMLVLETDSPYLEPEPRSLRRNEPGLLALWNRRAGVADSDVQCAIASGQDFDRRCWRGVFQGVVEQLAKRQPEQVAIGVDRQVLGNLLAKVVTIETPLELP